jgi:hypothetical protein
MSRNVILSEIRHLVESLQEQQEQISSHDGKIPRIELDIMMGNVRKLYENLHQLGKEDHSAPKAIPSPQVNIPAPMEMDRPQAVNAELQEPSAEIVFTTASDNAEPITETNESAEAPVTVQPEELLASVETRVEASLTEIHHEEEMPRAAVSSTVRKKAALPTASLFDEPESIGDTIEAKPTVYDTISAKAEDKSIGKKMQQEPVTDLKKSIGINEKFSFINELFDGDLDSYNRAIDQLNTCDGIGTALAVLESTYAQQYSWSTQGNAYLNLRRLIERRYS